MAKELFDVVMKVHGKSKLALFVSDTGLHGDAVWLPLSQIETQTIPGKPDYLEVTMPVWLASKEGLI